MIGRYWVLDTEGNGANPNEVIELGAVAIENGQLTEEMYSWRFRPFFPITYYATKVHGIRNSDLEKEPKIEEKSAEILGLLGNLPIIGHSVMSELYMLEPKFKEWKPAAAHDTLIMARRLMPGRERYKLTALGEDLGLIDEAKKMSQRKAHSGLFDAVLTALVCLKLKENHADEFERMFKSSDVMRSRAAKAHQHALKERKNQLKQLTRNQQIEIGNI